MEEIKEEIIDKPINIDTIKQSIELMGLSTIMSEDWAVELHNEFSKNYMSELSSFLQQERKYKTIYPKQEEVFNAYKLTALKDVNICLIGVEPQSDDNQSHGLSFSAKGSIKTPPSLQVIFKAIEESCYDGLKIDQDTNLTRWSKQGVLLLNTILTVEKGKSGSHDGKGWEQFTDKTIDILNKQDRKICFLLFGIEARNKCKLVDKDKHLIIQVEHPVVSSYNNRPWIYDDCFKKASTFVEENYNKKIIW